MSNEINKCCSVYSRKYGTPKTERVTIVGNELTPKEIKGFVTYLYDEEWWVACVLQVREDSE